MRRMAWQRPRRFERYAHPEPLDAPMMVRAHLRYREVLTLSGSSPGLQVLADRCTLWITQDGVMDDIIMRPGERLILTEPRRVLLQGMR